MSSAPLNARAGSLNVARASASGTLLKDGRAFIVGGVPPSPTPSPSPGSMAPVETYDPATDRFEAATELLREPYRASPIVATLPDGRVLVAGGSGFRLDAQGQPALSVVVSDSELWSPNTRSFSQGSSMVVGRYGAASVTLDDGRVLAIGGTGPDTATIQATIEAFDPATGRWSIAATMLGPRTGAAVAKLRDGRVLIAGGQAPQALAAAEIFDPKTNRTAPVGAMNEARGRASAITLNNGRVLIAGGLRGGALDTAELFDPQNARFTPLEGRLRHARSGASLALLPQGEVLVVGADQALLSNELFEPAAARFTDTEGPSPLRRRATTIGLADGRVLVAGGASQSQLRVSGADLYAKVPVEHGTPYAGGRVMLGTVRMYYIWYGDWSEKSRAILGDLAKNIGGSPRFGINRTYGDASGRYVSGQVRFAGQIDDAYSLGRTLSHDGIQEIVRAAITARKLPLDANGIYFVLTSADVEAELEYVGKTYRFCQDFCGYHEYFELGSARIKYAQVGNAERQCPSNCTAFSTPEWTPPNGDLGADGAASVVVHELEEATTDPELTAWYGENSDQCAWQFDYSPFFDGRDLLYQSASGGIANVRLGARDYLIQMNWLNVATPPEDKQLFDAYGDGYCAIGYPQ